MEEGKIIKQMELDGKKLVFRAPKSGDAPKLLEYINSLVEEGAKILIIERMTLENEEKYLEGLLKAVKSDRKYSFVVECEGKIIAHAHVERKIKERNRNEHICHIGIAIAKEFREKGLGTIIMEMLLDHAKTELKSEIVHLTVLSENEAAQKLYKKMGFREVGRIPKGAKYKDKYEDEIIMIKEL